MRLNRKEIYLKSHKGVNKAGFLELGCAVWQPLATGAVEPLKGAQSYLRCAALIKYTPDFSKLLQRNRIILYNLMDILDFSGDLALKNLPANAGGEGLIPGSGRSPGEGNGNPLQYSCLENPMDRGAWWVTVSGLAKSGTRLNNTTKNGVYWVQ